MQQKGGPYPVAFFLRLFGLCAGSALTLVRAPRAARCPGRGTWFGHRSSKITSKPSGRCVIILGLPASDSILSRVHVKS